MSTAAYMRVSTQAQTEGNGLAQQRQEISAYAAIQGLQIDDWYIDAKTGMSEDREQLNILKDQAQAGTLKKLVVDRVDRFGRTAEVNLSLFRQFTEWGVEVIFVQQAFEKLPATQAALMRTIYAAFAEYQRSELLSRMKSCKKAALQNGRFIGGGMPMGYTSGRKHGQLEIVPEEAEIVRDIFKMRHSGMTVTRMVESLNARCSTPGGSVWYPATVMRIVHREEFYRGNKTLHKSSLQTATPVHPAIL